MPDVQPQRTPQLPSTPVRSATSPKEPTPAPPLETLTIAKPPGAVSVELKLPLVEPGVRVFHVRCPHHSRADTYVAQAAGGKPNEAESKQYKEQWRELEQWVGGVHGNVSKILQELAGKHGAVDVFVEGMTKEKLGLAAFSMGIDAQNAEALPTARAEISSLKVKKQELKKQGALTPEKEKEIDKDIDYYTNIIDVVQGERAITAPLEELFKAGKIRLHEFEDPSRHRLSFDLATQGGSSAAFRKAQELREDFGLQAITKAPVKKGDAVIVVTGPDHDFLGNCVNFNLQNPDKKLSLTVITPLGLDSPPFDLRTVGKMRPRVSSVIESR